MKQLEFWPIPDRGNTTAAAEVPRQVGDSALVDSVPVRPDNVSPEGPFVDATAIILAEYRPDSTYQSRRGKKND